MYCSLLILVAPFLHGFSTVSNCYAYSNTHKHTKPNEDEASVTTSKNVSTVITRAVETLYTSTLGYISTHVNLH